MSSSPSIDWVLDKVADLAGGSREDDAALNVLLTLVGSLDPPPKAVSLEPVAGRVGKLRLARVLDHPGDLRVGAVRLLAALDVSSHWTITAPSLQAPVRETAVSIGLPPASRPAPAPETPVSPPVPERIMSSERAPVAETVSGQVPQAPPERARVTRPRQVRRADGRVVLTFPRPGEETDSELPSGGPSTGEPTGGEPELTSALQPSAQTAQGPFRRTIFGARRDGETERTPTDTEMHPADPGPGADGEDDL